MTTYKKKNYEKPSVRVILMESDESLMLNGSDRIQVSGDEFVENESSVLSTISAQWEEDSEEDSDF